MRYFKTTGEEITLQIFAGTILITTDKSMAEMLAHTKRTSFYPVHARHPSTKSLLKNFAYAVPKNETNITKNEMPLSSSTEIGNASA